MQSTQVEHWLTIRRLHTYVEGGHYPIPHEITTRNIDTTLEALVVYGKAWDILHHFRLRKLLFLAVR